MFRFSRSAVLIKNKNIFPVPPAARVCAVPYGGSRVPAEGRSTPRGTASTVALADSISHCLEDRVSSVMQTPESRRLQVALYIFVLGETRFRWFSFGVSCPVAFSFTV